MKILISSNIPNGTTVTDESGFELFETDNAGEFTLYLQGLLTEFPEAELVFQNNPVRGAIFEAGKLDGGKLKKESIRYKTSCSIGSLVSSLTSTSHGISYNEVLKINKKDINDPEIESCIIIDQRDKIVEITKGSVEPFKQLLDKKFPGWKVGKVIRE